MGLLITKAAIEKFLLQQPLAAEEIYKIFEITEAKLADKIYKYLDWFLGRGEVLLQLKKYVHITHLYPVDELYFLKERQKLKDTNLVLEPGRVLRWIETRSNEYLMELPGTELRGLFHPRQLHPYLRNE